MHIPKDELFKKQLLDLVYARGPISRVKLAELTGVTKATVSKIIAALLDENQIEELGKQENETVGRRKVLLGVKQGQDKYLGSELNAQFISVCLINNLGQVIKKEIYPTPLTPQKRFDVDQYLIILKDFIDQLDGVIPLGLGIVIPGHFSNKKAIVSNRYIWDGISLKGLINALNIPVSVENNVHAMALGYRLIPSRKVMHDFAFFHLAHGIFLFQIVNCNNKLNT